MNVTQKLISAALLECEMTDGADIVTPLWRYLCSPETAAAAALTGA